MARIRTVKPEYWTDEIVGECSVSARLLFIATWNFADDHGGLDRSSKQLKAQAFPYDNIDCEPLVQELLNNGLLVEYEVEGKKYLHIKGFGTHQKVEKKGRPRVPLYDNALKTPRLLPDSSLTPPLRVEVSSSEGKGREGKGNRTQRVPTEPVELERSTLFAQPPNPKASEAETIGKVFDHWRSVHHHVRAALDDKRRKIIREALKHYSEADLCQSISGYLNSPHHMGRNDRNTVYTDLELLLRDSGQVDAGLKFYDQPPRTDLSAKTRANVAAIADWKPPELRNAGQ